MSHAPLRFRPGQGTRVSGRILVRGFITRPTRPQCPVGRQRSTIRLPLRPSQALPNGSLSCAADSGTEHLQRLATSFHTVHSAQIDAERLKTCNPFPERNLPANWAVRNPIVTETFSGDRVAWTEVRLHTSYSIQNKVTRQCQTKQRTGEFHEQAHDRTTFPATAAATGGPRP